MHKLIVQSQYYLKPEGLALQAGAVGVLKSMQDGPLTGMELQYITNATGFTVPFGTVEWMLQKYPALAKLNTNPYVAGKLVPNRAYGHQEPGKSTVGIFTNTNSSIIFIKPILPKAFISRPYHKAEKLPTAFYWSSYTEFTHEWRAYIVNGRVVGTAWYRGVTDAFYELKPDFAAIFPNYPVEGVYAIDFGITHRGGKPEFDIIEIHLPYSIGNYLEKDDTGVYADFCISGWKWLQQLTNSLI